MKKIKVIEITAYGVEPVEYLQHKVILRSGKSVKIKIRNDDPKARKKLFKLARDIQQADDRDYLTSGVGDPVIGKDFRKWSKQLGW